MNQHQERTYLKVFIELPDDTKSKDDLKSNDDYLNAPNSGSFKTGSWGKSAADALKASKSDSTLNNTSNYPSTTSSSSSSAAQYTIVPITPMSTAADVCVSVARKRNLRYIDEDNIVHNNNNNNFDTFHKITILQ